MIIKKNNLNEFRFERKYILNKGNVDVFKNFLLKNNFSKTFEDREVNSIYYDTLDLNFFFDNIDGVPNRKKYRLRWYNYKNITLNLEIKKKKNFISEKEQIFIKIFANKKKLFEYLKNFSIKFRYEHKPLFPILKISYLRSYWLSQCKNYRATVDSNLSVQHMRNIEMHQHEMNIDLDILEFKYPINLDKKFRSEDYINKNIFRLQKNSKYVSGLIVLKDAGLL